MGFNVDGKDITRKLIRHLKDAEAEEASSMEKMSSGEKFSSMVNESAEKSLSESMEYRIRSLNASKKNVSDATSILQTAQDSMQEVNNIIIRMKELNTSATSSTVSNRDRRYLFVEYQALYDEIERIAITTEYNGIPLLYGASEKMPEKLVFRVDDPVSDENGEDLNIINLEGMKTINLTPAALGLRDARDILSQTSDEVGVTMESAQSLLMKDDSEYFETAYDRALTVLSTNRSVYGAMETRLDRAQDFIDVYQENLSAAKSKIADTNYAEETVHLVKARLATSANTALLAQGNVSAKQTLQLLSNL